MGRSAAQRNILLFLVDQWRGDTLRSLGHPCVKTPNIERLIADGVLFQRHYTTATPCGPARTSMLTGLYMMNHRMVRNGTPLDARHSNLALELRKAGYEAAIFGYTSNVPDPRVVSPNDPAFRDQHGNIPGFAEIAPGLPTAPAYMAHVKALGYDVPEDPHDFWLPVDGHPGAEERGPTYAPARFTSEHSDNAFLIDEAIKYLSVRENRPWFAHIATMRPHPPFIVPTPFHDLHHPDDVPPPVRAPTWQDEAAQHPLLDYLLRTTTQKDYFRTGNGLAATLDERDIRQLRATYFCMMEEIDVHFGRLIDYLKRSGQYDHTLIVFSSDHGEQLGDHYQLGKQGYFDASYHIPLIVRAPETGGGRGVRVDRFTEAVDLLPTILEWAGCDVPMVADGASLLPFCRGAVPERWREAAHYEFDFRDVLTGQPQAALGLGMEQCNLAVVRDTRWKYVHCAGLPPLLFDLDQDPGEFRNLAADPAHAAVVRDYAQKLLSWRMTHADRTLTYMQAGADGLKERRESRH